MKTFRIADLANDKTRAELRALGLKVRYRRLDQFWAYITIESSDSAAVVFLNVDSGETAVNYGSQWSNPWLKICRPESMIKVDEDGDFSVECV